METNLKFNSAICTSREQSERLLALGLKKETADMSYQVKFFGPFPQHLIDCTPSLLTHPPIDDERFIPAWSLHRLIEIYDKTCIFWTDCLDDPYEAMISRIADKIKRGELNKKYLE